MCIPKQALQPPLRSLPKKSSAQTNRPPSAQTKRSGLTRIAATMKKNLKKSHIYRNGSSATTLIFCLPRSCPLSLKLSKKTLILQYIYITQATGDEEIELDIDSLDKSVLWKLYRFVKKHTHPEKKLRQDGDEGLQKAMSSSSSGSDSDDSDGMSD